MCVFCTAATDVISCVVKTETRESMNLLFDRKTPGLAVPRLGALAVLCLSVSVPLMTGCGQKDAASGAAGMPPGGMPVQVQVVKTATIPDTAEYLSVMKSRHSANINPQVEGQITKIFVKSGDRVDAGQPLLQIDPLKQQATVSSQEAARVAQEANVQLAKVSYDWSKRLFEAGVIAKAELHYYGVRSPMNGIVGDIPVRIGDRVAVTTLLTTVDEPGALEAYIYVPVDRARGLRAGLPVKLLNESGELLTNTSITFVSPQVDSETQTVLAKAAVPNTNAQARLRVAQQVRAQVQWGQREGVTIPFLNLTRINGQYFVFVAVNEGKGTVARQKLVKIGDMAGNNVEVLDGIKPGDHLIVSGAQFLQDGAPVAEHEAPAAGPSTAKDAAAPTR